MTYNEAKLRQLSEATTFRIHGRVVELEQQGGSEDTALSPRKRWILIHPCLCVQDSPDNPCSCNMGVLWWLPRDGVVASGSGRKDEHGKELQFFDVLVEKTIMVESLQPVSVAALKGVGRDVTAQEVRDLGSIAVRRVLRRGTGSTVPPDTSGTAAAIGVDDFLLGVAIWAFTELLKDPTGEDGWLKKKLAELQK